MTQFERNRSMDNHRPVKHPENQPCFVLLGNSYSGDQALVECLYRSISNSFCRRYLLCKRTLFFGACQNSTRCVIHKLYPGHCIPRLGRIAVYQQHLPKSHIQVTIPRLLKQVVLLDRDHEVYSLFRSLHSLPENVTDCW